MRSIEEDSIIYSKMQPIVFRIRKKIFVLKELWQNNYETLYF